MRIVNNPNTPYLRNHYRAINLLISTKIHQSKLDFEAKIIKGNDIGQFYKNANHTISSTSRVTTLRSKKGELALDPLLQAELLNDFFSECFTDDHGTLTETRCTLPVDVGLS